MEFREVDKVGSKPSKLILEEETYAIVGSAMEVYYKLGNGFSEFIYQEALAIEFGLRGVEFEREREMRVEYKGVTLSRSYRADFLCYGQIIVELKATSQLCPADWSQVLNYLKVSGLRLGLIFNFGSAGRLEQKRVII